MSSFKAFQRKYITVEQALNALKVAKELDSENPRWYAGKLDLNGIYSDPVLIFSLKDDSEKKAVAGAGAKFKGEKQNMRSGNNGCKYLDIKIKIDGVYMPLNITTAGDEYDICLGGIKPPEGSIELEELRSINPDTKARPGEKDVVMLINEYNQRVSLDEESGELIIPEGTQHSKLFQILKMVSDAVIYDVKLSVSNGRKFVEFLSELKLSNKTIAASAALEKFDEAFPNIRKNNILALSVDSANEIQALFPKDIKTITNEILLLESKLTPNVCVSGDFYANREPVIGGYYKVKCMCSATGQITPLIYDKKKSDESGSPTPATVLNERDVEEPLTFNNIHKFITKGSQIQGNFYTEVSITRQGISFTLKASSMIVDHTDFNKKAEFEEPALWSASTPVIKSETAPTSVIKSETAPTSAPASAKINTDEDDGAFDEDDATEDDIFGAIGDN